MKFVNCFLLLTLVGGLWTTSGIVKTYRLNKLVAMGKIPYGPLPDSKKDYYSYNSLHSAFSSDLDLKRAEEFTKTEFEELILNSLDPIAQENFKQYLAPTLNFSVDYQIDPFWIISVMMVESRFDLKAQSNKNARGLMQIRPDTAEHLYQLMNKKIVNGDIANNLHLPLENIEVGIFYLKKLLQNFRLNYDHATIAYNLGPNKLKSLLSFDDIDTENFSYLIKVQDSYKSLTKNILKELKNRPKPFEKTYVVRGQGRKLEEQILGFYITTSPNDLKDVLLSSENLKHFSSISHSF